MSESTPQEKPESLGPAAQTAAAKESGPASSSHPSPPDKASSRTTKPRKPATTKRRTGTRSPTPRSATHREQEEALPALPSRPRVWPD
jgi:hypothetical protein